MTRRGNISVLPAGELFWEIGKLTLSETSSRNSARQTLVEPEQMEQAEGAVKLQLCPSQCPLHLYVLQWKT